jgi:hypothetical protein
VTLGGSEEFITGATAVTLGTGGAAAETLGDSVDGATGAGATGEPAGASDFGAAAFGAEATCGVFGFSVTTFGAAGVFSADLVRGAGTASARGCVTGAGGVVLACAEGEDGGTVASAVCGFAAGADDAGSLRTFGGSAWAVGVVSACFVITPGVGVATGGVSGTAGAAATKGGADGGTAAVAGAGATGVTSASFTGGGALTAGGGADMATGGASAASS